MRHEETRQLLNDHIDGLLSREQAEAVQAHLETCAACRLEVAELRSVLERARRLPDGIDPDRDLWPEIASRLEARPGADRQRVGRWADFWRPAMAAAAILTVVLLGVRNLGPSRGPVGQPAVATAPQKWVARLPEELAVLQALEAECRPVAKEWVQYASLLDRDPAAPTLGLLAQNLRILDLAIAELSTEWSADPQNSRLVRRLADYHRLRATLRNSAPELVTRI